MAVIMIRSTGGILLRGLYECTETGLFKHVEGGAGQTKRMTLSLFDRKPWRLTSFVLVERM